MRALSLTMVAAAVLASGCATKTATPGPATATSAAPAPVVAGEPVNCVQLQNIRETRVIDDRTIDFIMRDGRVLRNNLPISCPQLGFERAFTYRTSITQLCSVDIITVIQQSAGIRTGASCGLGKFTPIEPVKK